ncbi:ras-related GTP-binding protein A isoform X1 [Antedon mediterranea]|uniref:ras-related GTP-binding protein A isoform X1 n=1 Tax=Antedon mediterranea TaxID=105859 RepID=UPI003AF7ACCB
MSRMETRRRSQNGSRKKKVLLMGKSGSGKTSMRSIIFANYIARDTRRLGATIDVEHSHVRFLGNLVLNLWDCGGQEAFMENYFASQRDNIFRNVEVLIYVFDVESRELEKDMHYYQSCLEAILQNSPDANIFCLIHKMDLVQEDQRDVIFKEREDDLKRLSKPLICTCFRTSIWDETLYKAWSSIVYLLIPNVRQLETNLQKFADIIDADEVLLFERATFLVISHCQRKPHKDVHRFEKISNIIKQFKLSCSKLAASFQSMEVRNSNFASFIDVFTSNTYVMVIMSDPTIPSAATLINIKNARKHFERLERVESGSVM